MSNYMISNNDAYMKITSKPNYNFSKEDNSMWKTYI